MSQKNYMECPFCSGLVETKPGRQACPECHAGFAYDQERQRIFVDTANLRLPIHGTVCTRCGLVQSEKLRKCLHCNAALVGIQQ